jgi:(1->4)-alpha-D-glucan 1-alpha-D-glucosylmutase
MSWRAVYRLQLTPEFGFREAREIVPYLRDLGVSHLYLSPSLQARRASTHGYDVVDPTRISATLGGEDEFRALCNAGLGVLLDIVPNHMATSEEENRYWREPDLRRKFFDFDPATGWYRRFFDIGELGGVRVEDPDVFEETHRKVFELLDEGLVQGLRIDHPDGLADPAGYLERLRERGARHVWVEKILEPGEHLRDWPTEGTTGYEFANDVTALFVDPRGEQPLTELYQDVTGERRPFAELAYEAKLEQARTTFAQEFERLRALYDHPELETAAASLHVYRTYVEPWSGRVERQDVQAVATLSENLRRVLLLEEGPHDEFVTRWQQTTGPVMAKGIEDTAFYRYFRLTALNEVGGNPDRFFLPVEEFHRANLERLRRFPLHLLTSQTHDTKRSGDVRARIGVLSEFAEEWGAHVRAWRALDDPNEDYLLWQTLVGAWPIERERVEAYMQKALRESKRNTNWIEPNEQHERRVVEAIAGVYERLPRGFEEFAAKVAARGREVSLGQTLLRLTSPGVPDIYQGDEHETLSLVDPDNRRAVDWTRRESPKSDLIRRTLALRAEHPGAFVGDYEPLDLGPDRVGFVRGGRIRVEVPLRAGGPAQEVTVLGGTAHTLSR